MYIYITRYSMKRGKYCTTWTRGRIHTEAGLLTSTARATSRNKTWRYCRRVTASSTARSR